MAPRKLSAARRAELDGRRGGKAAAAALTPEQRLARARAGAAVRWAGKRSLPNDQASVLKRFKDAASITLGIAPGAGGKRRRAAIDALAAKGLITIESATDSLVTITKGQP